MTETRADFAGYAAAWASRADQHATDFRDVSYAVQLTEPKQAAHLAALRDQAERMALMWAAVAALHPAEPGPSLGRKFFLNEGGFEALDADGRGLCTASITPLDGHVGSGTTRRCVLAVGHYVDDFDAVDGPHRNRLDANDTSDVLITWLDWADGAVPHAVDRLSP